jgi:DNA-3-methyladenine glycosylase II
MPTARSKESKRDRPIPLDVARLRCAADRLARSDRGLGDIQSRLGPPPLWKRPATFATFVRIILEQQVSLASSKSTFDRLRNTCRGKPSAVNVLALGEPQLRTLGITRQKARYIHALAADVAGGRFSVGRLRHLPDDRLRSNITARLGLGDWSADVFMLLAVCRTDVLPVGDLALVKGMSEMDGRLYDTADKVIRRAETWRPYRSVATRMIWQLYLHNRGKPLP